MKKLILLFALFSVSIVSKAQNTDPISNSHQDTITSADKVDSPPNFPGGQEKFNEYIKKNLKYPKYDLANKSSGINFIRFVVEKDGSLTNIEPLRSFSTDSEKETIRLIKDSPKWTPAMAGGKPCRVRFTIPIKFELPDGN